MTTAQWEEGNGADGRNIFCSCLNGAGNNIIEIVIN